MEIFGWTLARTKALPLAPLSARGGGWYPIVREPYTGAWQHNVSVERESVLAYFAVYACITLIASDIGKLCLRLVEMIEDGIWEETESAAFSPVLRKPNRYQTIHKFIEQWIISKLVHGNAYVLKERDARRVVTALYVLDPTRVETLVAPDGSVYYRLQRDDLSGLPLEGRTVPASEIIHDPMITLFHPLVGVSPIFASGLSATQGLAIQAGSSKFFANSSQPGGILTAPGHIDEASAKRVKAWWQSEFSGGKIGSIAVVGDGLKYEGLTIPAVDAQLIEQLKWTADTICSCYHVPPYMIGVAAPPPYANVEPMVQLYYSECLQSLITNLERSLDEGLGLLLPIEGTQYGTEFDIDDLIWMDTGTRAKAAAESTGTLSPNEARKKFYAARRVKGGDSPMAQQQYFSLEALEERDQASPFAKAAPPATPPPSTQTEADGEPDEEALAARALDLMRKELETWAA